MSKSAVKAPTAEDQKQVERAKRIREKARKIAKNYLENIERNEKVGGKDVGEVYNGVWVVRPHIYVPSQEKLSFK
jgi:hypothetical protein